MGKVNMRRMEREVLEAVYELGRITFDSPATKSLTEKYPDKGGYDNPVQHLTVMVNYLLEERFLFPYFSSAGEEQRQGDARGLTPKGFERLQQLRHPIRTWLGANWFPVVVAVTTAAVSVASMVITVLTKLS